MESENPVRLLLEALYRHHDDPCCVDDRSLRGRRGLLRRDDGVPVCRIVCYCRKACGLTYEHALKLVHHAVDLGVAGGLVERRSSGRIALAPELARPLAAADVAARALQPEGKREYRALLERLEQRQRAREELERRRSLCREAAAAAASAAVEAETEEEAEEALAPFLSLSSAAAYETFPTPAPSPTPPRTRRADAILQWTFYGFLALIALIIVVNYLRRLDNYSSGFD